MSSEEIQTRISECKKRKREYIRLIKDIDLMRTSYVRSIATEMLNIANYKKMLKEQSK